MKDAALVIPPVPRTYPGPNFRGFWTLYLREVRRFWKVGLQTVFAPVITALLYMLVFVVAVKDVRTLMPGVPYALFVAPGLIMMQILNNAFANASSSLLQAKMMGLTPDFLTPPLSPTEQTAAFALGAMTRGIFVGLVTAIAVRFFTPLPVAHVWAIVYFAVGASMVMGLLGVFAGLWSEKFDHLAAATNFIVMPMTFLSGTFYLIDSLPQPFRALSQYNPFFYLIDGFRYGFIGQAEGSLTVGVLLTGALCVILATASWLLFKTGYRLKS